MKKTISLAIFLLFISFVSAQEINAGIEGRINSFSSTFFIFNSDDCTSANNDNLDFEVPPLVDEYVSFYSVVENKNLSIDCWNPKKGNRNLTLVYRIFDPANYTGMLYLYWDPAEFFVSSRPQVKLNSFLVDLSTGQRINMNTQSSAGFLNSQRERLFRIETSYEWCGDGIINLNERCDGTNLGGESCVSLGKKGGNLSCNQNTCLFNQTACYDEQGNPGDDGSIKNKNDGPSGGGGGGGGGGGDSQRERCADECVLGNRQCISNNSFRVCGNFDNDSCTEWGIEEKCLGIVSFCKDGFCYGCLSDKDCKEGFCINGRCETNCGKSCQELDLDCGKYYFCGKILDCGSCSSGFCNKGKCSNLPENAYKLNNLFCEANYLCSPWSECKVDFDFENLVLGKEWFRGEKERICFDKNKCYSTIKEKEDCFVRKEIFVKKATLCGKDYIEVYDKKTNSLIARMTDSRYSKKSVLEVFLLPKPLIECEDQKEDYKMSFFDRTMLFLDVRKIWRIFQ